MSEVQDKTAEAPRKSGWLLWAALGLIAVAAVLYGAMTLVFKSGQGEG